MVPTFVIGTGRCGSTLLSRILARHRDVLSISEFLTTLRVATQGQGFPVADLDGRELWRLLSAPDPFFDALVLGGLKVPELCYPYGSARFSPADGVPLICHMTLPLLTDDPDALFDELAGEVPAWPRRTAAEQYRALFRWLAGRLNRKVIVERSGAALAMLPLLQEQFPDARFVHIYRNGPDCALSMSRHPGFRRILRVLDEAKQVNRPVSSLLEQALPDDVRKRFHGLLAPPYDIQRLMQEDIPLSLFGEMWSSLVSAGMTALASLPAEKWTSVTYEDLVRNPEQQMARLAGFLGVSVTAAWLEAAGELIDSRRPEPSAELDSGTLASLVKACEPGTRAITAVEFRR